MEKKVTTKIPTGPCSPIVAICYDFDKTLSPDDMQNYSLIPQLGCKSEDFWKESNEFAKKNNMDRILAYMKLILKKAEEKSVPLTRADFKALGKDIKLFAGVEDWFKRINKFAKKMGIRVEHYIISAGLKEILEGTSIAKYFTKIYASEFCYDTRYKDPIWPCQVVNYTTKTQYLFRISKNCTDLSDESTVNEHIDDNKKRIPFSNFIYIGDSETDIPAMKIVKMRGGTSIGVYNEDLESIDRVRKLVNQNRIDFLLPANYSAGGYLEKVVQNTIVKMAQDISLSATKQEYKNFMQELDRIDEIVEQVKSYLQNSKLVPPKNKKQLKEKIKQLEQFKVGVRWEVRNLRISLGKKYSCMPLIAAQNYVERKLQEIVDLIDNTIATI